MKEIIKEYYIKPFKIMFLLASFVFSIITVSLFSITEISDLNLIQIIFLAFSICLIIISIFMEV
jgi:hypothetical protein